MALTAKQKRFVSEYLIDLNATQAAIRAGYSTKRASELGYQLLQKTTVQDAIEKAMNKREHRTEITADRVLQELAAVGFAKATDVVRVVRHHAENGREYQAVEIADTEQVAQDAQTAIASIKQGKHGIEIRMHDKIRALEMLGRHLGVFGEGSGDPPNPTKQITALADLINNPVADRVMPDD